jgi:hypothetical protein
MSGGDGHGGDCAGLGTASTCPDPVHGHSNASISVTAEAGAAECEVGEFVVTRDGVFRRPPQIETKPNAED